MSLLLLLDGDGGGGSGPLDIVDQALNQLVQPASGQFLGFTTPVAAEEQLQLLIYKFFLETIRIEDQANGDFFLKRYLDGPQAVWQTNQSHIFALKDLWSVTDIPDEFLKFLKNIVGWTSDLDAITDLLDSDGLRRLIASSVALWKIRGTEDAILSALTLVTGARMRSWNWFDLRWINGETGFGHEADGFDPHLLDGTGENEINIRIVDDGTLNRDLVRNVAALMRPSGERISINYLLLLDLFIVNGDNTQWGAHRLTVGEDASYFTVAGGTGKLDDGVNEEQAYTLEGAGTPGSGVASWGDYLFAARVRGLKKGIMWRRTDEDNFYWFQVDEDAELMYIYLRNAGVDSVLASASLPGDYVEDPTVYYMYRVAIVGDQMTVYADGVEMLSATDSTHTTGQAGIICAPSGTAEVDEVEVLNLPADTDYIDINTRVS